VAIDQHNVMSDDARLVAALLRIDRPQTAWTIGRLAKVDVDYAQQALDRMADQGDPAYAILSGATSAATYIKRSRIRLEPERQSAPPPRAHAQHPGRTWPNPTRPLSGAWRARLEWWVARS
jgi:hypothetical protein